ncbi:MAG: hypothetical protein Q4E89_00280 [Eubacteriales bacterium]|nr:hypothetical protein [Eubacteriales bacterium]
MTTEKNRGIVLSIVNAIYAITEKTQYQPAAAHTALSRKSVIRRAAAGNAELYAKKGGNNFGFEKYG